LSYTGEGAVLGKGFLLTVAPFLLLFGYPGLIVVNALNIDPTLLILLNGSTLASYHYSRMRITRFICRHLEIRGEICAVETDETTTQRRDPYAEGAEILLAGSFF